MVSGTQPLTAPGASATTLDGQRTHIFFFFQAEDGIRDLTVTGVQTCALPIFIPGSDGETGPNSDPNYLALRNITLDRKSTRLNSSHSQISYAVFCLKKKKHSTSRPQQRSNPPARLSHSSLPMRCFATVTCPTL